MRMMCSWAGGAEGNLFCCWGVVLVVLFSCICTGGSMVVVGVGMGMGIWGDWVRGIFEDGDVLGSSGAGNTN